MAQPGTGEVWKECDSQKGKGRCVLIGGTQQNYWLKYYTQETWVQFWSWTLQSFSSQPIQPFLLPLQHREFPLFLQTPTIWFKPSFASCTVHPLYPKTCKWTRISHVNWIEDIFPRDVMEPPSSFSHLPTNCSCAPTVLSKLDIEKPQTAITAQDNFGWSLIIRVIRQWEPSSGIFETPSKERQWDIVNILSLCKDKSWTHAVVVIKSLCLLVSDVFPCFL